MPSVNKALQEIDFNEDNEIAVVSDLTSTSENDSKQPLLWCSKYGKWMSPRKRLAVIKWVEDVAASDPEIPEYKKPVANSGCGNESGNGSSVSPNPVVSDAIPVIDLTTESDDDYKKTVQVKIPVHILKKSKHENCTGCDNEVAKSSSVSEDTILSDAIPVIDLTIESESENDDKKAIRVKRPVRILKKKSKKGNRPGNNGKKRKADLTDQGKNKRFLGP